MRANEKPPYFLIKAKTEEIIKDNGKNAHFTKEQLSDLMSTCVKLHRENSLLLPKEPCETMLKTTRIMLKKWSYDLQWKPSNTS